jgi:hypothetical protein
MSLGGDRRRLIAKASRASHLEAGWLQFFFYAAAVRAEGGR